MNEQTFIRSMKEMTDSVHQNAVDHGWHDKPRDFGTDCMNLVREISEAFDEYANNKDIDQIYYKGGKPEGIPIELADAVIRIMDICGKHNISLGYAMLRKHEYNKTRPYRHGNKKV